MMESPILMLVLGIALGVLLTAKPITELVMCVDEKTPAALPYVVFGFLLFMATWALEWLGFTVVITTFGLYQVFGSPDLWSKIRTFFKFGWLKRKKKVAEEPTMVIQPIQTPATVKAPKKPKVPTTDGPDEPALDEVDTGHPEGRNGPQVPAEVRE